MKKGVTRRDFLKSCIVASVTSPGLVRVVSVEPAEKKKFSVREKVKFIMDKTEIRFCGYTLWDGRGRVKRRFYLKRGEVDDAPEEKLAEHLDFFEKTYERSTGKKVDYRIAA